MTVRESQVRTLLAELANLVRRCERRTKLERMELFIKRVQSARPEVGLEVELRPCPADGDIAQQIIAEIEEKVARWEDDSGQWVERISLVWRGDPPARIPEDLHFRQA